MNPFNVANNFTCIRCALDQQLVALLHYYNQLDGDCLRVIPGAGFSCWSLRHEYFNYCAWKSNSDYNEMHHHDGCISDDMEKGNLNGANSFKGLQHGTKSSEGKQHCVEAIQIASCPQDSIVQSWFWSHPSRYSQWEYCEEKYNDDDKIKNVPTISARNGVFHYISQTFCNYFETWTL